MKLMLLYENYILFFLANKRRVRNLEGEGERMRGYKGRAGCQSPPPL